MVKIKLNAKHEKYNQEKAAISVLLNDKNINHCQILGADGWKFSLFSLRELDDMGLARLIGQMESVTEISFEKD